MSSVCCIWVVSYVMYISHVLLKRNRLHFLKSSFLGSNGPQKFCIEKVGKETWLPRSHTWWVVTCKLSVPLVGSLSWSCIYQIKWNLIWISALSPSSAPLIALHAHSENFSGCPILKFCYCTVHSLSVSDLSKVWDHPSCTELRGISLIFYFRGY